MNKYDKGVNLAIKSYEEALNIEKIINTKIGFEMTIISILLSVIIGMLSLFSKSTLFDSIINANQCKLKYLIVSTSIVISLVIIALIILLFAISIRKKDGLPSNELFEQLEQINEEQIDSQIIALLTGIANGIHSLNNTKAKFITIANTILISSLILLLFTNLIFVLI